MLLTKIMLNYIKGFLKNLTHKGVSMFAFVDNRSTLDPRCKINRNSHIINSNIGRYSYVGMNSWVCEAEVGAFCSIASNVNIGLGNHTMNFMSTSPIFTEPKNATGYSWTTENIAAPFKRVKIGNDVWIGYGALILGGVTIGDGACIGAGAIVTKDVEPYAIVGGNPAKVIRYRFPNEIIGALLKEKWWDATDMDLKNRVKDFQHPLL